MSPTEIDSLVHEYIKLYRNPVNIEQEEDENEESRNEDLDIIEETDTYVKVSKEKTEECIASEEFFKLRANDFNKKFKVLLDNNEVAPKDVMNYAISRISLKLETSLKAFDKVYKTLCYALADPYLS